MAQTTSAILVERLIDWEGETIFGLPGDGINGIVEGFRTLATTGCRRIAEGGK